MQAAFLELPPALLPAPTALARKTRNVAAEPLESGEAAGVFASLLLPLLPLDGSVGSGDGFAASVESPVVSVPGRIPETSSSTLLIFNGYDP